MIDLIRSNLEEIARICERYGVSTLEVFGSAANGTFDEQTSDVDFIYEFFPDHELTYSKRFFGLVNDLELLLGRSVDLITDPGASRNPIFVRSVNRAREVIYRGRSNRETAA